MRNSEHIWSKTTTQAREITEKQEEDYVACVVYFDLHLECAAPKRWSKYTTVMCILQFPFGSIMLFKINHKTAGLILTKSCTNTVLSSSKVLNWKSAS